MLESSMLCNKHWKIEELDMCVEKFMEGQIEFACEFQSAFLVHSNNTCNKTAYLTLCLQPEI